MATAMRMAHATATCFGEPSMSFGFGHRFGSKSIADRSIRGRVAIGATGVGERAAQGCRNPVTPGECMTAPYRPSLLMAATSDGLPAWRLDAAQPDWSLTRWAMDCRQDVLVGMLREANR